MSAAAQVWALVCGLPPPQRERWPIVALQGWVDDSGEQDAPDDPVFVLGGFIASASQWAAFSKEWAEVCDADPAICYFKMAEAASFRGQFDGWSVEARDEKVSELTAVIVKYARIKVHCSVDKRAFAKHARSMPVPKRSTIINKPYAIAFQHIILATAGAFLNYNIHESCDFIFDEQGRIGTDAVGMWETLKELVAHRAPKSGFDYAPFLGQRPIFRDDKVFLPLQASDLYAWHVRREFFENKVLYMPPRKVMRDLAAISTISWHVDEQELSDFRQYIDRGAAILMAEQDRNESALRSVPQSFPL